MKRWLFFCSLLFIFSSPWAAELTATLDRTQIHHTETVQLTIDLQGYNASGDPDLKALTSDFDILGSAKSHQVSVVNGQTSQQIQWQITLAPRRTGTFVIPPLQIGSLKTAPINLIVTKASTQLGKTDTLFLEVQADPKQPFINSQVFYTVKLYVAEPLQGGSLTDPVVANAIVMRLGTDNNYQTTRHGQQYQVIERHYGIFPQQNGPLSITPPTFLGQRFIRDRTDASLPELRPVRLTAETIGLTVQPKPASMTDTPWLPAQDLTINQTWSTDTGRMGEPIERTITLSAVGLNGEQLPDLGKISAEGFNVYPAQPKVSTTASNKAVLGQRAIKLTYIPTRAGKLIIPTLKLTWWNTLTQKPQTVSLPEKVIEVAATNNTYTDLSTTSIAAKPVDKPSYNVPAPAKNNWPWFITGAVTIAWLFTLSLWWRQQKSFTKVSVKKQRNQTLSGIEDACSKNNPQAVKSVLITWAQSHWPACRCLADVVEKITDTDLRAAILALDATLYAKEQTKWDGRTFWQIFNKAMSKQQKTSSKIEIILPPLYPM